MNMILASIGVFLAVVLLLVVILLVAKNFLVPSGNVKLTINGDKELEVASGSTLLNTLSVNGVFLSSACGGKGVQQFFCFVTVKDGIIYRFIIFSQRDTLIFTDIFVPVKRRQKKNDDTVQSDRKSVV